MNEEFSEQRVRLIRDLAEKADPFTKQRLLDLVKRYKDVRRVPFRAIPHSLANLPSESASGSIPAPL
jgi:hypothetical protein